MRNIPLDWLEEKARSFQVASQIAYNYSVSENTAFLRTWVINCQRNQAIASASARRYLWAAIERRKDNASQS